MSRLYALGCSDRAARKVELSVVEMQVSLISFFGWVVPHSLPSRVDVEIQKAFHLARALKGAHSLLMVQGYKGRAASVPFQ